ncbi:MAG: maltose alpha-D-glucosyltransferase [Verrucomicrobia bacterium]|nr:maltose alpha-D-glucosyltransferase [Verrucomicrobiota bacterium]
MQIQATHTLEVTTPAAPLWYKEALIYQVHVKTFSDSNNDGIGDFQGLYNKLDYLKNLGITAIWVMPFYPSPLKDDGYDISDYFNVNPSYGTLADFKLFLDAAHGLGLKVITELVLNHTSDQHAWFQRARHAKPGDPWRDYYVWSDTPDKYREARIIFKDTEVSNWTYDPVAKAYFWHRFYSHQPDLNYDHPALRAETFKIVDFWLDMGVDGLRLDAVPYLFEREGTSCENLPETHAYLRDLRAYIDSKYENRMLLAEANQWPEDAVAYFGQGDECHMAFHFPIMPRIYMSLHMEDRYPIVDILDQTPPIPDNCQWAMFLRNHDELTLEMVTEEERDYMYRVYARDPRARINLGIRRRLAPLLGNNRRKLELVHGILLSMPGSPILYYGDEIGMGDNIYLGDRNGVRTPMQWSADKNAGFSRANPHSLYLPVNIDPEFHYEAINVEVQETNLSSFLWWMRRIISIRKRFPAFGHGDFHILSPANHKVLAFTRTYESQTVLVVINLSRFSQCVELDLQKWAGWIPEDTFGHGRFPVIRDASYPITLGPNTFFWLVLTPPATQTAEVAYALPTIGFRGEPDWWFRPVGQRFIETDLTRYVRGTRWFRSKSREVLNVSLVDSVELSQADRTQLLLIGINYSEGPRDLYALPVKIVSGDEARNIQVEYPLALIAKTGTDGELLVDAVAAQSFHRELLDLVTGGTALKCRSGQLVPTATPTLKSILSEDSPQGSRPLKVEQSNSSIIFDDKLYLKLFRKLDEGLNPDLEVTKQLSERCRFEHVPTYLGDLQYTASRQDPAALIMLQGFTQAEQDGWSHALGAVDRYFDRVLGEPTLPQPPAVGIWDEIPMEQLHVLEGGHLESVRLLGQRTAEMHLALASDTQAPDFSPEPFTLLHQRSVFQSIRSESKQTMTLLGRTLHRVDDYARHLAEQVLARAGELSGLHEYLRREPISVSKIRIHGDYHLGQVLYTGKDFIILDFEGEPARSLGERRLKRSAIIDVAGMLRSFHYAAHYGLLESRTVRPQDREVLASYADLWSTRAGQVFLGAYLTRADGAAFVPGDRHALTALLRSYLVLKAMYELRYELNNRPKWVAIPLRGILKLVEEAGQPVAVAGAPLEQAVSPGV